MGKDLARMRIVQSLVPILLLAVPVPKAVVRPSHDTAYPFV